MNIYTMIESLFASKTISPSFKLPHVIYTIMLLGQATQGLGRYRIKNEIGLGEGSTKTLLSHLKKLGIISAESKRQMGHILTQMGHDLSQELIAIISIPNPIPNENNKYVVGEVAAYTIIKKKYQKTQLTIGISQRDEAIKIGGTGATVIMYNGQTFTFPDNYSVELPEISESLEAGDLLIIGGGITQNEANLSALAAGLSLLELPLKTN